MCGRYLITFIDNMQDEMFKIIQQAQEKVNARYSKNPKAQLHTGMIFPTNMVPIMTVDGIEAMFWGFHGWPTRSKTLKNPDGTPKMNKPKTIFNTRADTATKPTGRNMWRDSLQERRCIIPTSAFYEWKTLKNEKKKEYLFSLPRKKLTYIAGIYKPFKDDFGETWEHFSMMTTEPNESIKDVHDRMPIVLLPDEHDEWLTGDYLSLLDRQTVKLKKKVV